MNIEFNCANCGAGLKVLDKFAGRSIQCPKCAKKTEVPGGAPKPEPTPEPAAPLPPAVPPPPKAPEGVSAPEAPAALTPDADWTARLREQEQKIELLIRQVRDQEMRLEVEHMKAQKAEQEKIALATKQALDRQKLEADLAVHYKVEMEAAHKTISRLEEKVQEAVQQRLNTPDAGGRTAVQIEKELLENPDDALIESENAVPDAVMAEIRGSRFARYLRTSILLHVLLLGGTSIGMLKAWILPPPPPAEAGDTNAVPAVVSAPVAESPTAGPLPEAAPATSVVPAAIPSPVVPPPAKSETERQMEALPAPGEKPPSDTQVNLGL